MQGDTDRLPFITERDQLPEDQHEQYDRIADTRGRVRGPFGVLLNSPPIAGRIGHLGSYVRFESELSGAERELIILTVAREFDCRFEWVAHEPLAREAGVDGAAIDAVLDRAPTDELSEPASFIVAYVRSVLRDNAVPTALFERTKDHFGTRGITDATATIGYYSMLACVINAFEVVPEEGPSPW
ncbi:carboxymuconolactone decarboxylase family protein [Haloplanus litoreus]|uniref:Carboxymuconolactone decarboxylase family protein n=1 Tax=Haloplanus litoreus TaxID=767515 RepID=A0ABD6A299_9EURY